MSFIMYLKSLLLLLQLLLSLIVTPFTNGCICVTFMCSYYKVTAGVWVKQFYDKSGIFVLILREKLRDFDNLKAYQHYYQY